MLRHGKPEPWIEDLIINYGNPEEEKGGNKGQLKAYVIEVGQMSLSQAQSFKGHSGLIFLSDGVLKIPALLIPSAWEYLQEQEDRECLTSLLNTTVLLQNYRLEFHMSQEQTKCKFFLSVGKLVSTSAGPIKENTPCHTTLPFVRMKIYKTWMSLLGQVDGHSSQSGLDLSELLGEWQDDCLLGVVEDVKNCLTMSHPTSPQPNLTCSSTGWDLDRIKFKGEKSFTVPVECLLFSEENFQHLPAKGTHAERERESMHSFSSANEPQTSESAGVETMWDADDGSPVALVDAVVTGANNQTSCNPWDMFPPPSVSSSVDSSPEPHADPTSKPDSAPMTTSTQLPSKEPSDFPPYQKQQSNLTATSPTPANVSEVPTSEPQLAEPAPQSSYRKPKRKRSEDEEEVSGSPPSWLFDSLTESTEFEEATGSVQAQTVPRKTPVTHSDGQPFSYSYKVSGQNLQDFSLFKVATSYLHWATRYLLTPKKAAGPPGAP